jgi:hypothetical protein
MQLELAIATVCEPSRCRTIAIDGSGPIDTVYGAKVLNRIKVRPGDLVAVDLAQSPPAVVWRWWHGTVRTVDGESVAVERAVTIRAPGDTETTVLHAALPNALRGQVAAGDTVFFYGHGGAEGTTVIDVASESVPVHPERLQSELLPGVVAAYEQMAR